MALRMNFALGEVLGLGGLRRFLRSLPGIRMVSLALMGF